MTSGSDISLLRACDPICAHLRFIARMPRRDPKLLFLGQTLRGALGYALKDVACSMPHLECSNCPLRTACPFQTLFNGQTSLRKSGDSGEYGAVQPFVLEVAAPDFWWGEPDQLAWGVTLFGQEIARFPYVIEAFKRAGARGLGPARTPFVIESVRDAITHSELLPDSGSPPLPPSVRTLPLAERALRDGPMLWRFHTPVHFTTNGVLHDAGDAARIIHSGRRRFEALGGRAAAAEREVSRADFKVINSDLKHWRIERFSNRQKRRIPLEGYFGTVLIDGPWSLAGEWIHAAETIHIGKHTTFGLGRVSWTQSAATDSAPIQASTENPAVDRVKTGETPRGVSPIGPVHKSDTGIVYKR